jgi:hypothetical protein
VSIGWAGCVGGAGCAGDAGDGIEGAEDDAEAGLTDATVPRLGAEGPEAGGSEEGAEACPDEDEPEAVEFGAG